ncbi:opacity protein-like surface antigen [Nitrobacteraceae bacterium AZCC 1564]
MRKTIILAACAALLIGPAFAQTSQPQGGANPGASEMSKAAAKKGKSTTGMAGKTKQKMQKDGTKSKAPKY